jgi:hypothetical protein
MDLHLYLRVLWRFRVLVAAGFLLGLLLATLSVVRVDPGGAPVVSYREKEQWVSVATLLVTQPEFPLGRSVFEEQVPPVGTDRPQTFTPKYAPSSRFVELANVYAELVTGDAVRERMLEDGPVGGLVEAVPLVAQNGSDAPLPMVGIRGLATTPERAVTVAERASKAFQAYLAAEQNRDGVPPGERVVLREVRQPTLATTVLLEGRSKTVPIVVFLTVMLAVVGLAFVFENLRPRVRPVAAELQTAPAPKRVRARRSG